MWLLFSLKVQSGMNNEQFLFIFVGAELVFFHNPGSVPYLPPPPSRDVYQNIANHGSRFYEHTLLPPIFTLPLSCLIDFMSVHEKDPGFHLLCLYSQSNTKFSCALTLLTEIIPKFSSLLLLQEMLKSHFQLNLTWSTSGGMEKSSVWLNYEHTVLRVKRNLFISAFRFLLGSQETTIIVLFIIMICCILLPI